MIWPSIFRNLATLSEMIPRHQHQKASAPILIIGYMHSGTTLLQQVLGRHTDIFISGGETRFFVNFSTTVRKYPHLNDDQVFRSYLEYLLKVIFAGFAKVNFTRRAGYQPINLENHNIFPADVDELFHKAQHNRSHAALYAITFNFLASKHGKSRWLDKLAGHVSQVEVMRNVLPDAQVIELVRDPRDILASKKRRAAHGGDYDPVWDSLAWMTAVRAGIDAQQKWPAYHLRVRYEDLVSRPEETTREICHYLDLQFDPNMLSVGWVNSTTVQGEKASNRIGTDAVGKWRYLLPAADIAACQWIARKELQAGHYKQEPISPFVYLALPVLLLRSAFEFILRLYHKWRRGGSDLLRSVFNNYRLRFLRLLNS